MPQAQVQEQVEEQPVEDSTATNAEAPKPPKAPEPPEMDEFGRDAAERTVELCPRHAEMIEREVNDGRWQTYDDALRHVINRGLAEIKRTRDAARALASAKLALAKQKNYASLMQANPSLIANAEFVATMLRDLGVAPNGANKTSK